MDYRDGNRRITELRLQMAGARRAIRELRAMMAPQPVQDYTFQTSRGDVSLSSLFGDKTDLFVIHNMGSRCPYCTLWADGFNGAYDHLADRAAFVVSSPDAPEAQTRFAASRGWKFPMVSHRDSCFAQEMGYRSDKGGWLPGVSVFQRATGGIVRVADSGFEPGDDFCAVWHLFDLMPAGSADWQPDFSYGKA